MSTPIKRQTTCMKKFFALALAVTLGFLLLPPLPARAQSAPNAEKSLYLTFDDGPTDSTTPHVLDVLKEEKVPATFFLIGRQINGREEIVRRIAAEGHAIGVHTHSHEYKKIYASPAALLKDIALCKKEILRVLPNTQLTLYRFPGGGFTLSESLRDAVKKTGLRAVEWNASVEDAVDPAANAEKLFQNAVQSAKGKNEVILLLHDGVGYRATVECLPRLIGFFQQEGYVFRKLN